MGDFRVIFNDFFARKPKRDYNNKFLLVRCPTFCESGFHIAKWNSKTQLLISETNGDITKYVTEWARLPKVKYTFF